MLNGHTSPKFKSINKSETRPLLFSCLYFFSLLCSYYLLRPIRDEMGIRAGVENLSWLFSGTFFSMLLVIPIFGWLTNRYRRKIFLPICYIFFSTNILIFFFVLQMNIGERLVPTLFFIWLSVFNLFIISIFWSFMADIYSDSQARRLFGYIAAGGSAGAILGPTLAAILAPKIGTSALLPISFFFLLGSTICLTKLMIYLPEEKLKETTARLKTKTSIMTYIQGVALIVKSKYLQAISLFILIYSLLSTFLYFQQAELISTLSINPDKRTSLFAQIDLAVNLLTIGTQLLVFHRLIKSFNLAITLSLVPLLSILGFILLGIFPVLAVLIIFGVIRRAGEYAITKPAREILFTVLPFDEKYKAKNVIDTVIYRGGDAISGWIYEGLKLMGLGLVGISFLAAPVALYWAVIAKRLGKHQERLRVEKNES